MLEVRLLGQFDVRLHGQAVEIPSRPAQSLLAYLVLNAGTQHRRERLAGLLWPDATDGNSRSNLRHAIWRLRRALGDDADRFIQADNFGVTFDAASPHWLDAAALERASAGDSLEALIAAVGAYRGELLPGFYAEWVDLARERLQTVFERQMQTLLDRLAQSRRWNEVLTWAERWIALGQAPEPAYRALMQAHSGLGDVGSVAAVYQRCQATLRRDLGVDPSDQTRALYERLRRPDRAAATAAPPEASAPAASLTGPPSPARAATGGLPAPTTPLLGREAELREVSERLVNPDCRLLTLIGPGGIGKTRLAIHAALRLSNGAGPFADGVFFVPLSRVNASEFIVSAIADGLRLAFYGGEDLTSQLLGHLHERQILVVLDNFEHLLDGAELIAHLLYTAPGVKFLVTSQERLNLQGEWLYEVAALPVPWGEAGEAPVDQFASVQLFVQAAQRLDASFRAAPDDLPAIQRICQIVAGMPLGIELAAAWVRAISCAEIAREIERNLGFLTTTLRDVPERHRSLMAVFDYAWNRLSDDERQVFRRLSVFWGGFQREAAEQVVEASLAGLTALVDKSLLRRIASGRYDMHGLLRKFGELKLHEAGEFEAVRARREAYFLALVEQAESGLRSGEQLAWLARLETEHDNLRATLRWCLEGGSLDAGQRLAGGLARFWYLRGHWREGREWLAQLLEAGPRGAEALAAPDCTRAARAKALMGAGWLADENGTEGPAYEEALALCRAVGDRWGEAYALRGVAVFVSNEGDLDRSRTLLRESGDLFGALGDSWGLGLVAYNQGWLAFAQDDQVQAKSDWENALALFRRVGDRWGMAVSVGSLAYLARLGEHYAEAAELTEEALNRFREVGDRAGVATSLLRLAQVAFRRSSYPQAIELIHEGLTVQGEVDDVRGRITARSLLGLIACYRGRYAEAAAELREARLRGEEYWGVEATNFIANYEALVAYYCGDTATAQRLWEHGVTVQRTLEDRTGIAYCLFGLGRLAHDRGNLEDARRHLDEALALFKQGGDRRYVAIVLNWLGRLLHDQGQTDEALHHLKKSLLMRKEAGDRQGMAESFEALVMVLHAHPAVTADDLAQLLGAAEALREEIGAPRPPVEQPAIERAESALRERLGGEAAYARRFQAGRTLAAQDRMLAVAWTALGQAWAKA